MPTAHGEEQIAMENDRVLKTDTFRSKSEDALQEIERLLHELNQKMAVADPFLENNRSRVHELAGEYANLRDRVASKEGMVAG